MSRGGAAAATWTFRRDESRRRRGRDANIPWRPARAVGTSKPRRSRSSASRCRRRAAAERHQNLLVRWWSRWGLVAATPRGDTWIFRGAASRRCGAGAERGDLLEVRYEGRLRSTGEIFDGSAITFANGATVPGRGGDASIFFVLGMQPAGQFPPAWDAAMAGCCVGEVRKLSVPPVLGFGDKGSPKRGVPPFAALDYTLQLLSVNGDAQQR